MEKFYITFGQDHVHKHNGNILDNNCIGVIKAESYSKMRELAFEWFGDKFATTYTANEIGNKIQYFPRGFINLN